MQLSETRVEIESTVAGIFPSTMKSTHYLREGVKIKLHRAMRMMDHLKRIQIPTSQISQTPGLSSREHLLLKVRNTI